MTEGDVNNLSTTIDLNMKSNVNCLVTTNNSCKINECEIGETGTTDSDEYLSEPLRCKSFNSMETSTLTIMQDYENDVEDNDNFRHLNDLSFSNIEIPIVGYEVMEERARFTIFKLKIENKITGDCWFVFRRYTDFVRLCSKLKRSYPDIVQHLPRKRWLGNNFDPVFLEERVSGLQALVNSILSQPELIKFPHIQDFFCLNEPPVVSDVTQESRAMFDAFEDTIYQLQRQLKEKEALIDTLQDSLHSKILENDNLKKVIKNMSCEKCQKECTSISNSTSAIEGAEGYNSASSHQCLPI